MLYVLIVILAILSLVAIEIFVKSTIDIHFKDNVLTLKVITPFYKKQIVRDFNQKQSEVKAGDAKKETKDTEKLGFSQKLDDIKKRVFNKEKGFDIDELKSVWSELWETNSYVLGIIKKLFTKLRHKIHIKKLAIGVEYGTDNPATTGMIYGSVWNVVGIIYPVLTRYFYIEYPIIDVTPDFYGKRFDIEIRSIIKVSAAHIIWAGLSSLLIPSITYFKNKKGREKNGR